MNLRTFSVAVSSAALLSVAPLGVEAAWAQDGRTPERPAQDADAEDQERPSSAESGSSARQSSGRINREPRRRAPPPPPPPTPAENLAAAQALLTAAGVDCQASQAIRVGVNAAQEAAYEAACPGGAGYIVVASTPPAASNCLELAGQALTTRERDPAADVGQQCAVPENTDAVTPVAAWAKAAGVACTVDQASAIARSSADELIYEVGCRDEDGFWLQKAADRWTVTPCWDVTLGGGRCRFTTPDEGRRGWTKVLANSEASACDVQQARRAGRDAQNLTVYEVKCASGEGYFARVGADWAATRVATCEASANVAGGCTLTTAAPATTEQ